MDCALQSTRRTNISAAGGPLAPMLGPLCYTLMLFVTANHKPTNHAQNQNRALLHFSSALSATMHFSAAGRDTQAFNPQPPFCVLQMPCLPLPFLQRPPSSPCHLQHSSEPLPCLSHGCRGCAAVSSHLNTRMLNGRPPSCAVASSPQELVLARLKLGLLSPSSLLLPLLLHRQTVCPQGP